MSRPVEPSFRDYTGLLSVADLERMLHALESEARFDMHHHGEWLEPYGPYIRVVRDRLASIAEHRLVDETIRDVIDQAGEKPVIFDTKETNMQTTAAEDLTAKQAAVLKALTDLAGEGGATSAEWEEAAVAAGVSRRTFYGARNRLEELGLAAPSKVRWSPVEPPPPPLVSAEDVIGLVTEEGTRSKRFFDSYLEAPSMGRLQNLVRAVADELGAANGIARWRRTITADTYEATEAAVLAAVETLAGTEEGVMHMSKRVKPTRAELTAMNRGKAVTVYRPGSNRAEIRVAAGKRPKGGRGQ